MRIAIVRGPRRGNLIIDNADDLALSFFERDISSAGQDSYDEQAAMTDPRAPFVREDIAPIRTGMRLGRLKTETWDWMVDESPRTFLEQLAPRWDLVELSLDEWIAVRRLVRAAFIDFIGDGHGAAAATKMLHYKRPQLIPILDSLVLAMIGLSIPDFAKADHPEKEQRARERQADAGLRACDVLRKQAQDNMPVLLEIQRMLAERGIHRSLARILDALLWSVHPASEWSHSGAIRWGRT